MRIGVISDNHGYLDPAVLEIFAGVSHIIHAGDIMDPQILERLEAVAPVTAVAGNMDSGEPTSVLPREVVGEVAGVRFLVGHKRKRLLRDLAAGSIAGLATDKLDLVIYGHDHIPAAAWVDGTLYLDPGSASAPHEEDDGPTVAIVEVKTHRSGRDLRAGASESTRRGNRRPALGARYTTRDAPPQPARGVSGEAAIGPTRAGLLPQTGVLPLPAGSRVVH